MPLVQKEPFKPNPIPDNLGPDDEVFYLPITNEIFTSHDEFFDRFLFCNSLIWTCSRTGKSGLTYKEALDSEQQGVVKRKKGKRERKEEPNNQDGEEPVKKKKKKYPYDPKKYSMPVPEGFDPSLLTPTGKIDGRKLKSKKNKQLAEELLQTSIANQPPDTPSKRGKKKKSPEDEAKQKEENLKKKMEMQAELARERELEAKRKKEAAAMAKQLERQKREEERKKAAAFLQNWEKKCEDLERDDLRRLPQPTPLICDIPERMFGDALFIMESLYNLHDLYQFDQVFPDGLTYDTLEEMLLDRQEDGPLDTLIRYLLKIIFITQPTGDGYGLDDDPSKKAVELKPEPAESVKINPVKTENVDTECDQYHETNGVGSEHDEDDENEDKDVNMNDLIGSAIKAAQEVKASLPRPLPEMEITQTNVTEILRLHFLQSGSFPKGRTIYNGWYSSREDPGLWLCMQHPDLIKKLAEATIHDLSIDERIKIIHTLIYQLFTFIKTRTYIESASDQLTELRKTLRKEIADFARWDRENYVKKMQHETGGTNSNAANGEQTSEEHERAYQQNLVDYEDHQRERAVRQEQLNENLITLRTDLRKFGSVYGIRPIGRDRAYRRYWLFQSLPGLFVEQDDDYVGQCLPNPTPLESQYKKLFNKDNPLMHADEADLLRVKTCDVACSTSPTEMPQQSELTNGNSEHPKIEDNDKDSGHDCDDHDRLNEDDEHENEQTDITDEMNYCTGDQSTCAVHGKKRPNRTRWWFYHTPESIDSLINCLNKRGYRESKLLDVLVAENVIIKPWVAECPAYKLNKFILEQSGIRRSRRLRVKGSKRRGRNHKDQD